MAKDSPKIPSLLLCGATWAPARGFQTPDSSKSIRTKPGGKKQRRCLGKRSFMVILEQGTRLSDGSRFFGGLKRDEGAPNPWGKASGNRAGGGWGLSQAAWSDPISQLMDAVQDNTFQGILHPWVSRAGWKWPELKLEGILGWRGKAVEYPGMDGGSGSLREEEQHPHPCHWSALPQGCGGSNIAWGQIHKF